MLPLTQIVPALLVVLSGAISSYLAFGQDATIIQVFSASTLLLIIAAPILAAWRESRKAVLADEFEATRAAVYSGPTDLNSAILSVLSLALLSLVLVFPVRWPAALSFGLAMVNLSLKVASRTPLRDIFVALVAMASLWPIAPEIVARTETRIESYLSRLVGDRLDSQEILNYPEGGQIQTLKGDVPMTGANGNLNGIRLGVLTGCAVGLLMIRGPVHVLLLSASGFFWAIVINGFWVYGKALNLNGASGLESLWGKAPLAVLGGLILILSSDQLLLVLGLLNPIMWIRRERKGGGFTTDVADSSEAGNEPEPEPAPAMKVPAAVFWAFGVVGLVITGLDAVQVMEIRQANHKVESQWQAFAKNSENKAWPDRLGRWVRSNTDLLGPAPHFSHQSNTANISATYVLNNRVARVCWVGPSSGWVDRFQDYVLKGWKLGGVRTSQSSNTTVPKHFLLAELSRPTGEKAVLVYAMSSVDGENHLDPSVRSLSRVVWWHLLQSLFMNGSKNEKYYLTEICLESYSMPKESENQMIDELVTNAMNQPLPVDLKSTN